MHRDCHRTAARMIATDGTCDPARLHGALYAMLSEADNLAREAGSELHSAQVIAAMIWLWKKKNPGEAAYG